MLTIWSRLQVCMLHFPRWSLDLSPKGEYPFLFCPLVDTSSSVLLRILFTTNSASQKIVETSKTSDELAYITSKQLFMASGVLRAPRSLHLTTVGNALFNHWINQGIPSSLVTQKLPKLGPPGKA